ncbi:MAG: flagellar basal body P-ring protein FlgI [Chloroflexi bacterium]|nr:flagellar basal body P-ring protein FlgI [Chloroflexota bacterium]
MIHNQFAGFQTAMEVVTAINDVNLRTLAGDQDLAHAVNAKVITVALPVFYQENPAELVGIVAMILRQELKSPLSAKRVFINERRQSIIIDGDVTIAPCLINHQGMAIEMTGGSRFVAVDLDDPENPKLKDLLSALNAVSASTEVAIQVIKDLDNNGNLYGELVIE